MGSIYCFSTANNGYRNAPQYYVILALPVLSTYPAVMSNHSRHKNHLSCDSIISYFEYSYLKYLEKPRRQME